MTACDSLKHTAVFRSVGCRAAIPPVTEEMRVGKSVLAGIVQKGLYLPILSVEFVLLAAVDAAIKRVDFFLLPIHLKPPFRQLPCDLTDTYIIRWGKISVKFSRVYFFVSLSSKRLIFSVAVAPLEA